MVHIDRDAPLRFLATGYAPDDHVAVFLKVSSTAASMQRIVSVASARGARFQAWLRACNAQGWNIFVSVNAVAPGCSRTKDAIASVRHVFLDVDDNADAVRAAIAIRTTLPPPSYVLHSSPGRAHIFWRVTGMDTLHVEVVQKHLARELGTDPAATSCAQLTRLPGFRNHKYAAAPPVAMEYLAADLVYPASRFPVPLDVTPSVDVDSPCRNVGPSREHRAEPAHRARAFLHAMAPAVEGQRGDVHTFRMCCRLVRGFALSDEDALPLLREWNAGCQPPWSEAELLAKVHAARRYGREQVGGLL